VRGRESTQVVAHPVAHEGGVVLQVLLLHDVEHRLRRGDRDLRCGRRC